MASGRSFLCRLKRDPFVCGSAAICCDTLWLTCMDAYQTPDHYLLPFIDSNLPTPASAPLTSQQWIFFRVPAHQSKTCRPLYKKTACRTNNILFLLICHQKDSSCYSGRCHLVYTTLVRNTSRSFFFPKLHGLPPEWQGYSVTRL